MTAPEPNALILVAVLNDLRDLEIARLLGWYRIPLKRAPRVVAVDYLAFYQTASFGEQRWQIQWLAPVRGHELVTRRELLRDEPDHPRAREEYYKIQLGPLFQLPQPIPAGNWKRITFVYTTGEYLMAAKTINDIVVHDDERKLLWQSLREGAGQAQLYQAGQLPDLDLDPAVLAALLGFGSIEHD